MISNECKSRVPCNNNFVNNSIVTKPVSMGEMRILDGSCNGNAEGTLFLGDCGRHINSMGLHMKSSRLCIINVIMPLKRIFLHPATGMSARQTLGEQGINFHPRASQSLVDTRTDGQRIPNTTYTAFCRVFLWHVISEQFLVRLC